MSVPENPSAALPARPLGPDEVKHIVKVAFERNLIDGKAWRWFMDRIETHTGCHICANDLGHCCRHDGECAEVHGPAKASGQECCAAAAPNHTPLCPVAGRYAVKQAGTSTAAPLPSHEE